VLEFILILVCACVYAAVHMGNAWLFQWLEISSHISWVYLPAFLRLFYILVLGRLNGFLAIFVGGLILNSSFDEPTFTAIFNNVCSGLSPILACVCFERWHRRRVQLSAWSDLLQLTVIYCLVNALVHHLSWAALDPSQFHERLQLAAMVVGDFLGCLVGVGLMKAAIDRFGLPQGGSHSPPLN